MLISTASIEDAKQLLSISLDVGRPDELGVRELVEGYSRRRYPHPISVNEAKELLDKVVSCLEAQVYDAHEVARVKGLGLLTTEFKVRIPRTGAPGAAIYYFTVSKFVE